MDWLIALLKRPLIAIAAPLVHAYMSGHIRSSFIRKAVSKKGMALPWYTLPAVQFLQTRDFSQCNVLEFGGGQSTIWWAKNAKNVVTFEDDPQWIQRCVSRTGSNSTWHLVEKGLEGSKLTSYIMEQLNPDEEISNKFDVIIVDAMHRETLIQLALNLVVDDGMVIVDNAEGYNIAQLTKNSRFMRIDLIGPANGVYSIHSTSLFFGPKCRLLSASQPIQWQ